MSVSLWEKPSGHEAATQPLVPMLRMCGAVPQCAILFYVLHYYSIFMCSLFNNITLQEQLSLTVHSLGLRR